MGCAHLMESRTVAKFSAALDKKDSKLVEAASTEEFHKKALRHAKALDDFQVLNLPDGKINVIKVEDDGPNRKKVKVEVGERKQKLQYELVRDKKTRKWLVDDIRTPQKRNGLVVARSVTEQMDLLLTAREFLDACAGGERKQILAVTTPELQMALKKLPPKSLAGLAKEVAGSKADQAKFRPKATLDGTAARILLRRKTGDIVMALSQIDGKWKIADVAAESKGGKRHVASLLKKAVVVQATREFLRAYEAGDKKKLAKLCTPKLYSESLDYADLSTFPLPKSSGDNTNFDIALKGDRANAVLPGDQNTMVRITLAAIKPDDKDARSGNEYRVEDVAIYRLDGKQEVRISSFFVSRAWVKEFAQALAIGDLTVLRKASSVDFNRRVWGMADKNLMRTLPVMGLTTPRVRIETATYHGPVTEVMVRQGNKDATYVLRERQGRVRVDDVKVLEYGKPKSLKAYLELAIPIARFSRGIEERKLAELQQNSSRGLNRLVWMQCREVPSSAGFAPRFLKERISAIDRNGDDYLVTLGDDKHGARVLLVHENSRYVVEDVTLIAGPLPNQRAQLKQKLRLELATSTRNSQMARGDRQAHNMQSPPSTRKVDDQMSDRRKADQSHRMGVRQAGHRVGDERASLTPIQVDPHGTAFSHPADDGGMR